MRRFDLHLTVLHRADGFLLAVAPSGIMVTLADSALVDTSIVLETVDAPNTEDAA